jgi:hypothetical protein
MTSPVSAVDTHVACARSSKPKRTEKAHSEPHRSRTGGAQAYPNPTIIISTEQEEPSSNQAEAPPRNQISINMKPNKPQKPMAKQAKIHRLLGHDHRESPTLTNQFDEIVQGSSGQNHTTSADIRLKQAKPTTLVSRKIVSNPERLKKFRTEEKNTAQEVKACVVINRFLTNTACKTNNTCELQSKRVQLMPDVPLVPNVPDSDAERKNHVPVSRKMGADGDTTIQSMSETICINFVPGVVLDAGDSPDLMENKMLQQNQNVKPAFPSPQLTSAPQRPVSV